MSTVADGGRSPVPGARTPVSVVITTRDEEEQLPGALASVARWAAEIVVVLDPRTRDRSAAIAAGAGARVAVHPFESSAAQCNWAIAQARNRWALVLDADERVTPALAAGIAEALRAPRHDAYAVRRVNFAFGRRQRFGDWGRDRVVRLLDRERARFRELAVHGAVEAASIGTLSGGLEHHTLRSLAQYLPKLHDYAARGAADLVAAGRQSGVVRALAHAEWRFVRGYLLRGGFLDGASGLAVAILNAYGSFLKYLVAWERSRSGTAAGAADTR